MATEQPTEQNYIDSRAHEIVDWLTFSGEWSEREAGEPDTPRTLTAALWFTSASYREAVGKRIQELLAERGLPPAQ